MAKYYKDYTEEEKLRIVDDMINSNLTYKELMEKHSIGARSYKKLRDEYNIRKIAIRNKKFKVNDDYFEIIDTEEKAYWLGFLYADGCVARKGNYYTIKIDQALYDYEHVLKFKEAINSTYPVKNIQPSAVYVYWMACNSFSHIFPHRSLMHSYQ